MPRLMNIVNPLHRRTARDYLGRMSDDKVHCSKVARRFDRDYWDGDRRYGYGGYKYDGRWAAVARQLIDAYGLKDDARILDVGCGRGFLLYEFTRLLPRCTVVGFDISQCAIDTAKEEVRSKLFQHRAQDAFPYADRSFDLVISLNALHNLPPQEVVAALKEMERVGRNKYLVVESFKDAEELFNLQCWALTCETFFRPATWSWLYGLAGYMGDYEYIYFENPEPLAKPQAAA
ncbi:MAG TPA: class I SAM-dependent methyltransferase [Urbifossiella sp.]|nr:class I SAM-dependent methyltransferase [Urbifossiella sp.]